MLQRLERLADIIAELIDESEIHMVSDPDSDNTRPSGVYEFGDLDPDGIRVQAQASHEYEQLQRSLIAPLENAVSESRQRIEAANDSLRAIIYQQGTTRCQTTAETYSEAVRALEAIAEAVAGL